MKARSLSSLALAALACTQLGDQARDAKPAEMNLTIDGNCLDGSCCPAGTTRIFLTPNDDHFVGSDADRCVVAQEGRDTVTINTDGGSAVFGGPGADRIVTGLGPDIVKGGSGDDVIHSRHGADSIFGNSGNDDIQSGDDNDTVVPGPGKDTVRAGTGDDTVAIYHECELPVDAGRNPNSREKLDGGNGHDTLITPLSEQELESRGVDVDKFETILIEQNGCKSECACPANNTCVEGTAPGAVECFDSGLAGCAEVTLLPSATRPLHVHRFGAGALVDVAVDLRLSPGTEKTTVTIEPCEGAGLRGFKRSFFGDSAFLVFGVQGAPWPKTGWAPLFTDTAWDWVNAACVEVKATTFDLNGVETGGALARIRRGNGAITGRLVPPEGSGALDLFNVVVEADVLSTTNEFVHLPVRTTDSDGNYRIEAVPAGTLIRLRAQRPELPDQLLRGDISPLLQLGATATVDIPLVFASPPGDGFEPNDALAQLTGKPSAVLGTAQTHNLHSDFDVDIIPFDVTTGTSYRISVTPGGPRPGDLIVQIIDSTQAVLASANVTLEDFQPSPVVTWAATLSGRVFAKISRRDDEDVDAPYTIVVEAL